MMSLLTRHTYYYVLRTTLSKAEGTLKRTELNTTPYYFLPQKKMELSVYISSKTSGIRTAVSKKGNQPSSAISKGHNSKDKTANPLQFGLRIQQVVLSTTRMKNQHGHGV